VRQLFLATVAAVAMAGFSANTVQAGKVELKDVHLCCQRCVNDAKAVLGKVDGVTDVNCDRMTKTIAFATKDAATSTAALKALCDAGFYGAASEDGKAVKLDVATPKAGEKADEVSIKNVHLCCPACKAAVSKALTDMKVEFSGKSDVKVTGKDIDKSKLLETLHKAGFNGKIE
jgi:periplasmic mercuric ion binding protein